MRKLRLDELEVETFTTGTDTGVRGTVRGHNATWHCTMECSDQPTCDWECGASFPYQKACEPSEFCPSSNC